MLKELSELELTEVSGGWDEYGNDDFDWGPLLELSEEDEKNWGWGSDWRPGDCCSCTCSTVGNSDYIPMDFSTNNSINGWNPSSPWISPW